MGRQLINFTPDSLAEYLESSIDSFMEGFYDETSRTERATLVHAAIEQLSEAYPAINLAEGEYLDEETGGDVDSDYEPTERLVRELYRTDWDQGYRKMNGTTVIFRPFTPEEDDLIVARDFADDDAAADWLATQPNKQ